MIYLLCSTIRPKMFKATHADWMSKADNTNDVITKLVVDTKMDQEALKDFDVMLYTGDSIGLTKPITQLTQSLEGLNDNDIIIVMSDDFYPPQHWDTFLQKTYEDYTGALSVYDGGPPNVQATIITIPIMDYKTLKKMNGMTSSIPI